MCKSTIVYYEWERENYASDGPKRVYSITVCWGDRHSACGYVAYHVRAQQPEPRRDEKDLGAFPRYQSGLATDGKRTHEARFTAGSYAAGIDDTPSGTQPLCGPSPCSDTFRIVGWLYSWAARATENHRPRSWANPTLLLRRHVRIVCSGEKGAGGGVVVPLLWWGLDERLSTQ